jgi:hypothetical protein
MPIIHILGVLTVNQVGGGVNDSSFVNITAQISPELENIFPH